MAECSRADPPPADEGLWGSHEEMVQSTREAVRTDDIPGRARSELRGFLGRDLVGIKADPLVVWEGIKTLYPYLYKVARRLLSVVATSVPSERFFSRAGDIMDDKGSRLTARHLEQRLFLASIELDVWTAAEIPK